MAGAFKGDFLANIIRIIKLKPSNSTPQFYPGMTIGTLTLSHLDPEMYTFQKHEESETDYNPKARKAWSESFGESCFKNYNPIPCRLLLNHKFFLLRMVHQEHVGTNMPSLALAQIW